jgi:hypothetical protein
MGIKDMRNFSEVRRDIPFDNKILKVAFNLTKISNNVSRI